MHGNGDESENEQWWNRETDIDERAHERIDNSAKVTRQESENRADDETQETREKTNIKGERGAYDQDGQNIPALSVGS